MRFRIGRKRLLYRSLTFRTRRFCPDDNFPYTGFYVFDDLPAEENDSTVEENDIINRCTQGIIDYYINIRTNISCINVQYCMYVNCCSVRNDKLSCLSA